MPEVDLYQAGFLPPCYTEGARHELTVSTASPVSTVLQGGVDGAILRTLPNGPGQRHGAIFRLARGLKAIPELADAPWDKLKPGHDPSPSASRGKRALTNKRRQLSAIKPRSLFLHHFINRPVRLQQLAQSA